jgi:hypothetical protein
MNQMLLEIAISTARLQAMIEQAHALCEHLQNRPPMVPVKTWATQDSRVKTP